MAVLAGVILDASDGGVLGAAEVEDGDFGGGAEADGEAGHAESGGGEDAGGGAGVEAAGVAFAEVGGDPGGAEEGDADLSAVGVSGDDEIATVSGGDELGGAGDVGVVGEEEAREIFGEVAEGGVVVLVVAPEVADAGEDEARGGFSVQGFRVQGWASSQFPVPGSQLGLKGSCLIC